MKLSFIINISWKYWKDNINYYLSFKVNASGFRIISKTKRIRKNGFGSDSNLLRPLIRIRQRKFYQCEILSKRIIASKFFHWIQPDILIIKIVNFFAKNNTFKTKLHPNPSDQIKTGSAKKQIPNPASDLQLGFHQSLYSIYRRGRTV